MGRIRRRLFFEEIYNKVEADKVILAHHQDDQVETFLMRLARGTSLNGIECMKINDGIYFRPMLYTSKKDILEYINLNDLRFVQDDSNFDTNFTRNFIRLELLPKLKKLNPKFNDSITNFISNVSDINTYLGEQINYFRKNFLYEFNKLKVLKLNSEILETRSLFKSLIYKVLIDDLNAGDDISSKNLDDIIKLIYSTKSSGQVHLSNSLIVEKGYKNIFFYNSSELYPEDFQYNFSYKKYKKNFFEFNFERKNKVKQNFSYLKVSSPKEITIRLNKPGDKIFYSKKKKMKKLHDIFINEKIPKFIRPYIPVVEYKGKIIKVIGITAKSFFESEYNEKNVLSLRYYSKLLEVIL
jgi:tRNA(Ile)-lysidine synthase